jgi:hypothetical protein
MILESEDEGAAASDSSEESIDDSSGDGGGNSSIPTQSAATNSPRRIDAMDWDDIERVAVQILQDVVNIDGVFHDRWLLEVSSNFIPVGIFYIIHIIIVQDAVLGTHGDFIEEVLIKIRNEPREVYNQQSHGRQRYLAVDAVLPTGIKQAMRPLATEGMLPN